MATAKKIKVDQSNSEKASSVSVDLRTSAILVHPNQRGNPLLKSITNVSLTFDKSIVPDYVMGRSTCAIYLSLKYHEQNPDYITERVKQLKQLYELRVLLVEVNVASPSESLNYLTKLCILSDLTLMVAWNSKQAGVIIENYKIYENKPPDIIMEKTDTDPRSNVINALATVRSVNRTDADMLLKMFGTLENVIRSNKETLQLCSGLGPNKVSQLHSTLAKPFLKCNKPNIPANEDSNEPSCST